MSAEVFDIADGVVEALNGHTFAAPFEEFLQAERFLDPPAYKLADLTELKVTVMAAAATGTLASRARTRDMRYDIDIGFQQKVALPVNSPDSQQRINELMDLVEAVADFLFAMESLSGLAATPVAITQSPIYDPERLKFGEFLSALTVTYQVFR